LTANKQTFENALLRIKTLHYIILKERVPYIEQTTGWTTEKSDREKGFSPLQTLQIRSETETAPYSMGTDVLFWEQSGRGLN
jgi:helix-turn-helix protein